MEYVYSYLDSLLVLTNETAPYLLLGFLFAGILHVLMKQKKIERLMGGRNFKSVVNASLFGIPLPLCSCGVIPTGVSLYKNGAGKGSAVSFLISTPQTGVDSILITYSILGLPFAIIRPIIAFVTGVFGGAVTNAITKEEQDSEMLKNMGHEHAEDSKKSPFVRIFRYGFVTFLQDIAKWLVIGLLLAALISVLVPDTFFKEQIGSDIGSMFIMLLASVPLYICATSSVPIAAVLMMKGISPGAALVFLMAGPATNAATMTVIGKALGKKTLFAYLTSIIGGALLFGFMIDAFLPREWFNVVGMIHEGHSTLPAWLAYGSSIILIVLMIYGWLDRKGFFVSKKSKEIDMGVKFNGEKEVVVKGMTCNHCKSSVEKNLSKLEGVESVSVDLEAQTAKVVGSDIDVDEIQKTIDELGFSFCGVKQ